MLYSEGIRVYTLYVQYVPTMPIAICDVNFVLEDRKRPGTERTKVKVNKLN